MLSVQGCLDLLGKRVQDRVTGQRGVVTTIAFDLFGCVQAVVHPGLSPEGKPLESAWYDVSRLVVIDGARVMDAPTFSAETKDKGPSDKPSLNRLPG